MQQNLSENKFIAPMSDLCQQWQQNGQLNISWYLEMVQSFSAKKILFNAVKINSPLFVELNKQSKKYDLSPEYIVTAASLSEVDNLKELLDAGIRFTVLFYSPLSADFIDKIRNLEKYLNLFNFVIIARKDWNVRNTYRSIPHFMRKKLFVDFPISLHEKDPFYESHELSSVIKKIEGDFLDFKIQSYCPNIRLHSEWVESNVSYFSKPRKLTSVKPLVSIIASESKSLQKLLNSKVLQEQPEKFEILVTRVLGQKTKVVPKIKLVTTTRYWAHPNDSTKGVPAALLDNFSASQADGEFLFFIDSETIDEIESMLVLLLDTRLNLEELLVRKNTLVFRKTDFNRIAGFDELLQSKVGRNTDVTIRLARQRKETDVLQAYFKTYLKQDFDFESDLDRKLMVHKFIDSINDFVAPDKGDSGAKADGVSKHEAFENARYRAEQTKDIYFSLYNSTPRVTLEGHFSYIKEPLLRILFRLKHFLKLHGWKLNVVSYLKHFGRLHSWRINPIVYRFYWKLPHYLFKIAFPVRKVYYFLNYQYEKRLLGLHKKIKLRGH